MCEECGCGLTTNEPTSHAHSHGHPHTHHHGHTHDDARVIEVRQSILSRNERLAERNRGMFMAHGVTAVNLMSSPGSGKTAWLEHIFAAEPGLSAAVITGDLATENDAQRLQTAGARAVQITTGTVCHLDAHLLHHALEQLPLAELNWLFIENVGNLVCPASFDLGEQLRVVLMSVTEGEDKPLKYPVIFHDADLVLLTKIDLADAVEFDRERANTAIRQVAPQAGIIECSAKTGTGYDAWRDWLDRKTQRPHRFTSE